MPFRLAASHPTEARHKDFSSSRRRHASEYVLGTGRPRAPTRGIPPTLMPASWTFAVLILSRQPSNIPDLQNAVTSTSRLFNMNLLEDWHSVAQGSCYIPDERDGPCDHNILHLLIASLHDQRPASAVHVMLQFFWQLYLISAALHLLLAIPTQNFVTDQQIGGLAKRNADPHFHEEAYEKLLWRSAQTNTVFPRADILKLRRHTSNYHNSILFRCRRPHLQNEPRLHLEDPVCHYIWWVNDLHKQRAELFCLNYTTWSIQS